jgi:hypothetical protein
MTAAGGTIRMTNLHTELPIKRKTKIVATIGPACGSLDQLAAMIRAGMNVARLNLSHGTLVEHKQQIKLLRQASEQNCYRGPVSHCSPMVGMAMQTVSV